MSATISRREVIRRSLLGTAGLLATDGLPLVGWALAHADHSSEQHGLKPILPATNAKAKSVIQIWMWGGPPHLDTFDPKPAAGNDYTGPLNHPIPTNVDGIVIGELLPLLAK
ncbi:MAG: DUF1501 domain-containing protein, partial [Planctomycetes bacterium]|nr:DUF1501 domain-containing protein [Planctomycetota bacterium]